MFLGDVLVGEVEGIGVDSFEAVYLAIWNAKQDLREREIKFGYRFYWEDVEKGGLGQELDLDVSFGFYK